MEKILQLITRNPTFREKTWRKYREQLPETVHLGKKNMEKTLRTITRNRTFREKNHGENIANNYQKLYIKVEKIWRTIANNYQKPFI